MPTMFDVNTNDLLEEVAKKLKEMPEFKPPEWAGYVKTGMHKERPPADIEWWYMRVAAILRSVRLLGPIGTSKLRRKYGGRKNRGHAPDKFFKGSGNIIRKALQQLETAGLIKQLKKEKGKKHGRVATPAGVSLLDKTAVDLYKVKPAKKPEPKKEVKSEAKPAPEKKPEAKPEEKVTEKKEEPKKEVKKEKSEAKPEKKETEKPAEAKVEEKKIEIKELDKVPM